MLRDQSALLAALHGYGCTFPSLPRWWQWSASGASEVINQDPLGPQRLWHPPKKQNPEAIFDRFLWVEVLNLPYSTHVPCVQAMGCANVCVGGPHATPYMWQSEDNLQVLVLAFPSCLIRTLSCCIIQVNWLTNFRSFICLLPFPIACWDYRGLHYHVQLLCRFRGSKCRLKGHTAKCFYPRSHLSIAWSYLFICSSVSALLSCLQMFTKRGLSNVSMHLLPFWSRYFRVE